jgi:hypothetical protein
MESVVVADQHRRGGSDGQLLFVHDVSFRVVPVRLLRSYMFPYTDDLLLLALKTPVFSRVNLRAG